MAEFVSYTLDGDASITKVRPVARITGIEVREDRVLVIYFVQGNPVVLQCGTQAEQLAREIMVGLATTPSMKQGNRLITSIVEVVVEPTHPSQSSHSAQPRPATATSLPSAPTTVLPPLRPAADSRRYSLMP